MTRTRTTVRNKSAAPQTRSRGGVMMGIFIGLVLGALFAAGAAWYFTRNSPVQAPPAAENRPTAPAAPVAAARPPAVLPGKPGERPAEKQELDFYRILPQGTETAAEPARPARQADAPKPQPERLYLQVGAFEDPSEADNMKALLTLNGIDASAQRAQLADGRIVHRVRVGPYSRPDDMRDVRARLATAGFTATVVRAAP